MDFSNIPRYPHKLDKHGCLKPIPIFRKCEDTTTEYIMKFKEVLVAWGIIDEDIRMSLFVMSLGLVGDEDVNDWYDRIPPKGISSLLQLVEALCNKWDPSVDK